MLLSVNVTVLSPMTASLKCRHTANFSFDINGALLAALQNPVSAFQLSAVGLCVRIHNTQAIRTANNSTSS